jgi:hypothetical protein
MDWQRSYSPFPSARKKHWYFHLTVLLVGMLVLGYPTVVKIVTIAPDFAAWDIMHQIQSAKPSEDVGRAAVPREIVALRQRHSLRPLQERESGNNIQNVPRGTYGFSTCGAASLRNGRSDQSLLEIHKRLDGIVYYVGYASKDDVTKYFARKKNFHILASPSSVGGKLVLFEIPIDFVAKCRVRPGQDRQIVDLFVSSIPKLH